MIKLSVKIEDTASQTVSCAAMNCETENDVKAAFSTLNHLLYNEEEKIKKNMAEAAEAAAAGPGEV